MGDERKLEFIVLIRNAIVGAGDHDGPPKIGTIFGFPEGKSSFFRLRRCDFTPQNHRGVEVAAPYDESAKLKFAPQERTEWVQWCIDICRPGARIVRGDPPLN